MKRFTNLRLAWLAALLAAAPAAFAGGIDDFPLSKAIPADVFMVEHARGHSGQAFVNAQYERVWDALYKSGIDKEVKKLVATAFEGEDGPQQAEELWAKVGDLLASVEWGKLGERESAFAMKLGFPTPEFVLLLRPAAGRTADNFNGLAGILKAVSEQLPDFALGEDDQGDTAIRTLTATNAPFPVGVTLARHGDVIMFAFGATLGEQSLAMLKSGEGATLAATPRFAEAFKSLPAPTDSLTFVDAAKLIDQLKGYVGGIMEMVPQPAEDEPGSAEFKKWAALPNKIIDALDMIDYAATVVTTQDKRTQSDGVTVRADASSKPLYKAFFGNGTLKDPLKYVPAGAGGCSVAAGVDWTALYQAIVKFVTDEVPDGAQAIEEFKAAQESAGIDVEKDVLGWIGGQFVTFSLPGKTQFAPAEFCIMLGVRDEPKANEMINRLVALVEPLLKQQNGTVEEAEIGGVAGFHSFLHPMLAMIPGLSRPTIGVHDGWLIFGAGPKSIEAAFETAAGKADNFAKNERFMKEGLPVAANVQSLSFTDTSRRGEELGQALQMAPMIGMMMGSEIQKNPGLGAVLRILSKLGPVVQKLNFFLSDCSQATFDGHVIRTQAVTNYREPGPATPPAPAPSSEESGGSGM